MSASKHALNVGFIVGAVVVSLAAADAAAAAGVLTASNGRTLYTYDRDVAGKPTCNALCAAAWPPYLANGEKKGGGLATVQRANGSLQWAYDGKPVYFYARDTKKGDKLGDGVGGIWHVVNE